MMEIDNYIGVILLVGIISFLVLHFLRWKIAKDMMHFEKDMERYVDQLLREQWSSIQEQIRDWNEYTERTIREGLARQWDNGVKARRVP